MLARRAGFYGYISVFCGFLAYLVVVGNHMGLMTVIGVMAREMGWTTTQFGVGLSLYMLAGLASPLYGALIQQWGPRKSVMAGTALGAVCWLAISNTRSVGQFSAAMLFLGMGAWMSSILPLSQLVGNWFLRRTQMLGFAMTAGGFGGLIFNNLDQAMTTAFGSWRTTWLVVAGLHLAVCLIAFLFIRDRPQELGQHVDGQATAGQVTSSPAGRAYRTRRQWEVGEAWRTRSAWLIVFASASIGFAVQGMLSQQVIYFKESLLMTPAAAAAAAGLLSLASIGGRIGGGWLGARFPVRAVMAGLMSTVAFSMLLLGLWRSPAAAIVYALMFGPGQGAMVMLPNAALMDYFGVKNFARLSGLVNAPVCLVMASAPIIIGGLRDALGTYVPGFLMMAALVLAAAAAVLLARPPQAPEHSG